MKYRRSRYLLLVSLVSAGLLLTACGGTVTHSWPGLAVRGDTAFFAYNGNIAAIQVGNGQQLWKYPDAADTTLMFYSNPWVDSQGRLTAGSYFGPVVQLDSATGRLLWKFDGNKGKIFGPLLEDQQNLIASSEDGKLYFLNSTDGSVRRSIVLGKASWGSMAGDGKRIYLATMEHEVFALDEASGTTVWSYDAGTSIAGGLTLAGNSLLMGTFGGNVIALDATTGGLLWKTPASGWVWSAPVVVGDQAFFADLAGTVRALSLADGKILWSVALGKPVTMQLVSSEGVVFVGSDDGKVRALSLADGAQKWEATLEGGAHGTMALAGDRLLVTVAGGPSPLVALSVGNGSILWKFEGVK